MTMRLKVLIGLLLAVVTLPACDPCFGVLACEEPALRGEGLVVLHVTGDAAHRAEVWFIPAEGAPPDMDSLRVFTRVDGVFRLEAQAPAGTDSVNGKLVFRGPDPYSTYMFSADATLHTVDRRGDARFLGVFAVGPFRSRHPHLSYDFEFVFEDTREYAEDLTVTFQQVAGVGVSPETLVTRTDSLGRAPYRATADADGTARVRVSVEADPPYRNDTFEVDLATLRGSGEVRFIAERIVPLD